MANAYTTRLKKRLPAIGDENWDDEWHDNEKIDEVVAGALLSANRVISGGAVTAGTGLVANYALMTVLVAGVAYPISASSLSLTAAQPGLEQANWVYVSSSGVMTVSITPPSGDYVPLARVDTSETAIIRIADLRPLISAGSRVAPFAASNLDVNSINSGQISGHRNKVRNGDFSINQRAVTGTVTLAAGVYGHDGWKAGASGCTYTFATTLNITTITITAGSLVQVIEGLFLQSGTYCLSWGGTAQGKIGAGSYGASGITGTAVGGTNLNIEFGTGTVMFVQFEWGIVASLFEYRLNELQLCQRYLPSYKYDNSQNFFAIGQCYSATGAMLLLPFVIAVRIPPTGIITGGTSYINVSQANTVGVITTGVAFVGASISMGMINVTGASGLVAGNATTAFFNNAAGKIIFTGCEL